MIMKMDFISKVVNMKSIAMLGTKHGSHKLYLPSPNNLSSVSKLYRFPLTSFPTKPPKYVRLKATSTLTCDDQGSTRKFKKQPPSPWTDRFHSVFINVSEMDALQKEIDVLIPKMKYKLMSSSQGTDSTKEKILMIYLLVNLGLACHFEDEIKETLEEGFEKIEKMMDSEDDLYTVSIIFWVLRRYFYNISSDVFKRFKESNGNFKESLIGDVKGMLSLYEASHLGTTKCNIMDEALSFTSTHLKSLSACATCPPHLSLHIRNSLILPQHLTMEVLLPIEYIPFYENEKDHDEMLLKFAKINFKLRQLHCQQELKTLTKWYKDLDLSSKLPPFFRDRAVENYFFSLAVLHKPELSRARLLFTKYFIALTFHDDIFDRYASLPEAESLANSFLSWSPDHAMDNHPAYLKSAYQSILDILKDVERELGEEGRSESFNLAIEEFKLLSKANFDFAKWALRGHVPCFEEYMEVGEVEIAVSSALVATLVSLGTATKEAFEWLTSIPKPVKSLSIKGRLMNDITGYEGDMSRGYVTNAVNCYMNQYGVTKEEALRELNKMVEEADKIINEGLLTEVSVERCALEAVIDLSRMLSFIYHIEEGFTNPERKTNDYMTSMFDDWISF